MKYKVLRGVIAGGRELKAGEIIDGEKFSKSDIFELKFGKTIVEFDEPKKPAERPQGKKNDEPKK